MDRTEAIAILEEVQRRAREAKGQRWCPHVPTAKQAAFLALLVLEALYGGAAGGGKSDALLMGALQHVDVPGYAALILRRTYADLALPGAVMDRAAQWLRGSAARWNDQKKTWTFPSGATLTFGYLEHEEDKYRYQSSEFQYIALDELTQFTETQYTYMLSRLRRLAGSAVPLRARGATNPGGRGHDWVKRRFIDDTSGKRAFVPATLEDNPHLDRDAYEVALAELDHVTQQQLRRGIWVRDTQGLIYKYHPDRNAVAAMPDTYPVDVGARRDVGWRHGLTIDFGASEAKPTTAIGVLAFRRAEDRHVYVVESEKKPGLSVSDIVDRIHALEKEYGAFDYVNGDQGGLGAGYLKEMRQRHTIPITGVEKVNKLGYRKLMNDDFTAGRILVVEPRNAELVEEWNTLEWNEEGTDNEKGADNHCSDMALYGWRSARHWLAKLSDDLPPPGSDERANIEAKKAKARRAEKIRGRKQQPWWARRD